MKPNKYLHVQKAVLKELDNSDLIHANGGDVKFSRTMLKSRRFPPLPSNSLQAPRDRPRPQTLRSFRLPRRIPSEATRP